MQTLKHWVSRLRNPTPAEPPLNASGVLLVCTGNLCRSPMAEGLFRAALTHVSDVTVASAGTGAPAGCPADPWAIELLSERGLDISNHMARQVTPSMIRAFPLVLAMDESHRRWLLRRSRAAKGRVWRLGEWGGFDVPDPVGGGREEFEEALGLMEQGVADWVRRIWPLPREPGQAGRV